MSPVLPKDKKICNDFGLLVMSQTLQCIRCSHIQSKYVDEGSDKNLEFYS